MQIEPRAPARTRMALPDSTLSQLPAPERQRFTRILLVEDDEVQLETLIDLLAHEGFEVVGCTTGAEALVRAQHQDFGVIVLDLHLPDMDGTAVLDKLRELGSPARAIINTGFGTFQAARAALNSGAFAFVEKLADPEELVRHVRRAVTEQVSRYAADLEAAVARRTADLRESEARLRAIIESSPDALIVTDEEGRIDTFNPTAERMFGHSALQVLGRPIHEFIVTQPLLPPAEFLARVWRAVPTLPTPLAENLHGRRSDGSLFPVDVELGEANLQGRPHLTAFVRDLTERRRQEEERRQAQKMEAIGRLAGGIAHDFNNLLSVIGGYTELLLAKSGASASELDMAQQIQQAVARGAALTRQLLAFSRQQPLVPQVLDLNAVVRAAERLLQRLLGADVELTTDLAAELPPIRADVNQLEQVLLNLAVNARDALPEGGRLTIRTLALDDDVLLEVEDTGVGMDDYTREHLFEPFFTTKPLGKGTGLGLATVYGIVQRFGGHIDVKSALGRGTTIRLLFPRSGEPLPAPPPPTDAAALAGGRETILVVEDEAPVRDLLRRCLEADGYQVLLAAGGAEALQVLKAGHDIRLLVTDLTMPKMGGRELARLARASWPHLKVLYISGYSATPLAQQEALSADEAFLQKPFPLPLLTRSVRELLERKALA
jgi:two-component system cell cycle sensor histidine kinase/response regulator CckA